MGARTGHSTTRPPRRVDESMSLLTDLLANSVDADYATAARRRGGPTGGRGPRRGRGIAIVGVVATLAVFGAMLGISAVQNEQRQPELAEERSQLISQIVEQRDQVDEMRQTVTELETEVAGLEASGRQLAELSEGYSRQLARLELVTGAVPARGPGIEITVDNSQDESLGHRGKVLDSDLQVLVNGLWQAGAEAIALNSQRVITLTSIRSASSAITVNGVSLRRPYVVTVIGDPDTLQANFYDTAAGQAWIDFQNNFGVRMDITARDSITVPGRAARTLRFAHAGSPEPE